MYITKETKWQLSCHCHDNSYATGPLLITTKIPRFHLTQGSSTPNNLMGRVKTMWEPRLFWGRTPVPLKKVTNGDIWFFTERDWNQECCHGNNIVGVILFLLWCTFLVPRLKITAPIFLKIFLIQYFLLFQWNYLWCHHVPHLHNTKTWISLKQKRIFKKEKWHSSLLWKAFQISSNYFLLHRHFKRVCIWNSSRTRSVKCSLLGFFGSVRTALQNNL